MSTSSQPFEPGAEAWPRVAALRRRLIDPSADVQAAVVGGGTSGLAAVRLLRAMGAKVRVLDDRPAEALGDDPALSEIDIGPIEADALVDSDLVVLSPGVPRVRPALAAAAADGRLVGEVELASWFIRTPLIGITGTNGKSTTTALVAHMLRQADKRVFAGGNFGRPLAELALAEREDADAFDVAVVELSSYQLESVVQAQFLVGCWLNLTPDHLDRYSDVDAYAAAKRRLIERRSIHGVAVLNADDPVVYGVGRGLRGNVRWFSSRTLEPSAAGTWMIDADRANRAPDPQSMSRPVINRQAGATETYVIDGPALLGPHNRSNACAAIECARFLDAPPAAVQQGLSTFEGLPHRLEHVGRIGRVSFYNDSKATNVDAAVTAVRAVPKPIFLIAGGVDKGGSWAPLVEAAQRRVEAVFAIGESAPLVASVFESASIPVQQAGTLERAVEAAATRAAQKDEDAAVLLAPACASFDQFKSYGARGDAFRTAVQQRMGQTGEL